MKTEQKKGPGHLTDDQIEQVRKAIIRWQQMEDSAPKNVLFEKAIYERMKNYCWNFMEKGLWKANRYRGANDYSIIIWTYEQKKSARDKGLFMGVKTFDPVKGAFHGHFKYHCEQPIWNELVVKAGIGSKPPVEPIEIEELDEEKIAAKTIYAKKDKTIHTERQLNELICISKLSNQNEPPTRPWMYKITDQVFFWERSPEEAVKEIRDEGEHTISKERESKLINIWRRIIRRCTELKK